jgi:hypothetical protein
MFHITIMAVATSFAVLMVLAYHVGYVRGYKNGVEHTRIRAFKHPKRGE